MTNHFLTSGDPVTHIHRGVVRGINTVMSDLSKSRRIIEPPYEQRASFVMSRPDAPDR